METAMKAEKKQTDSVFVFEKHFPDPMDLLQQKFNRNPRILIKRLDLVDNEDQLRRFEAVRLANPDLKAPQAARLSTVIFSSLRVSHCSS